MESAARTADCCPHETEPARHGWSFASLAPVVACAFCPACVSVWSALASAIGVGAGGSVASGGHDLLTAGACALALGVAGWRAWRERGWAPLPFPVAGCGLLALGHVTGREEAELAGAAAFVAGAVFDHWRHRRAHRLGLAH